LLIFLIAFIPVLFNYKRIWSIGYFKFEKNFISDYSEGRVGIEIKINFDQYQGARCSGVVNVRTISSGNVQVHGITHIRYEIFAENVRASNVNDYIDPAVQSWSRAFIISVYKHDNVTCKGFAEVNFSIGGLDQIGLLNFEMGYVVPISVADIFYVYDLPFIWVVFFYFIFLFVVCYVVYRKYSYIKFHYGYTEEMKEKDKIFFKYIEDEAKREENKKNFD